MRPYIVLIPLLLGSTAFGHVHLLLPTGGDELEVGSTSTIRWQITVSHGQLNWDLYYSTESGAGPWIPIAIDLPTGSQKQNSVHTYDWVVPNIEDDSVWVKVIMDNPQTDYDDTNDLPFSIIAAAACEGDIGGDGYVDVSDLLAVIDQWGAAKSEADINMDGIVNVTDLLIVVGNWGPCD